MTNPVEEIFFTILEHQERFRARDDQGKEEFLYSVQVPNKQIAHNLRLQFYRFRLAQKAAAYELDPSDPHYAYTPFQVFKVRVIPTLPAPAHLVQFREDQLIIGNFTLLPPVLPPSKKLFTQKP